MRKLEKLQIQNFKSIRDQTLELGALNVLIGANGVGKSNLVQAFRFLREIASRNLARYSLERGADVLLFRGRKVSSFMEFQIQFGEEDISNGYRIRLIPTDENTLAVDSETVSFHNRKKHPKGPFNQPLGGAAREAKLDTSEDGIAIYVRHDIESYRLYHFHDTGETAAVKGPSNVEDNKFLRPDAANLAAFLFRLQRTNVQIFRNIEDIVRQIAPFFDGFNLAPSRLNPEKIRLEWREKGSDVYFNGTALSDGSLRFICLATLLMQPDLPAVVLLDEPELGLHPAAVALLAEMLSSASERTQLLVATQSVTLINHLEPEQVWTAERKNGESVFQHVAKGDLANWLETYEGTEGYGLGDLWEKNLLGGRP